MRQEQEKGIVMPELKPLTNSGKKQLLKLVNGMFSHFEMDGFPAPPELVDLKGLISGLLPQETATDKDTELE